MTERFEMTALYPPHTGEDDAAWTNRILSHSRDHGVNRQCSINWHEECSNPAGDQCNCICHDPATRIYSVEGHPEGVTQVVTRSEEGRIRMPPVPGEPEGTWAEWIYGYSEDDAARRAIKKQEAKANA